MSCLGAHFWSIILQISCPKSRLRKVTERLVSVGVMEVQLRAPLKPLGMIVLWWFEGFQGGPQLAPLDTPRDASLSLRLIAVVFQVRPFDDILANWHVYTGILTRRNSLLSSPKYPRKGVNYRRYRGLVWRGIVFFLVHLFFLIFIFGRKFQWRAELMKPRCEIFAWKSFLNLVSLNQIWIVIIIFKFIWHQTESRLVPNQ